MPRLDAATRSRSALIESTRSDDEFVADAARYLAEAGGKRFRPLLCVLAVALR